ncbi:segregation/condensation protein A [Kytococcus schroeteri]|uniref:Segregation and condensation protein A n=1 Tax=Kytococcus schroeteri TaxID=138300 RepID=A0A2I1PDM2_9MICO|nr:ScpA family protein [Kytococcus schroeteri]PKZ42725.1 segregation/condensation protein A [Kytococcus schroeteri]
MTDLPPPAAGTTPGGVLTHRRPVPFHVHQSAYEGPFDLLLGLIAKHRLDVTEIALAQVTDEFIAHLREAQRAASEAEAGGDRAASAWLLGELSEFLVVASTLLELKANRLLPAETRSEVEDLEFIEARDVLFARLLQYRAYKQVAAWMAERTGQAGGAVPRMAGLEERFAAVLPDLVMTVTPDQLAMVAAGALSPRPEPVVGVEHLHAPTVSVTEQVSLMSARLREAGRLTFAELIGDASTRLEVVGRFLGVLEMLRSGTVDVTQSAPLGPMEVVWSPGATGHTGPRE